MRTAVSPLLTEPLHACQVSALLGAAARTPSPIRLHGDLSPEEIEQRQAQHLGSGSPVSIPSVQLLLRPARLFRGAELNAVSCLRYYSFRDSRFGRALVCEELAEAFCTWPAPLGMMRISHKLRRMQLENSKWRMRNLPKWMAMFYRSAVPPEAGHGSEVRARLLECAAARGTLTGSCFRQELKQKLLEAVVFPRQLQDFDLRAHLLDKCGGLGRFGAASQHAAPVAGAARALSASAAPRVALPEQRSAEQAEEDRQRSAAARAEREAEAFLALWGNRRVATGLEEALRESSIRLKNLMQEYVEGTELYERLSALPHAQLEAHECSFKRSAQKKDWSMRFAPTNLQIHICSVTGDEDEDAQDADADADAEPRRRARHAAQRGRQLVFDTVTMGAPAAHAYGFSEDGLLYLRDQLFVHCRALALQCHSADSLHAALHSGDLVRTVAEAQRLEFELAKRADVVLAQATTALIASFVTRTLTMLHEGADLGFLSSAGYLLEVESLLSTSGSEAGMLQDLVVGLQLLQRVQFVFSCAPAASEGGEADCTYPLLGFMRGIGMCHPR